MPAPGEIWFDSAYYRDETGSPKPKYFLVLGEDKGDVSIRLLTSQQHGRPDTHSCYEDETYPGFYLGVLGPPLVKPTWLDLRGADDIDSQLFARQVAAKQLTLVMKLDKALCCPALDCAARAADTTKAQQRRIYASRALLGCT